MAHMAHMAHMARIFRRMRLILPLVALLAMATSGGIAQAANSSEQVVFSGTGFGSFAGTPSPFGFWVWCEATSNNPYAGECNGAMYVYALGLTKHVDGTISEPTDGMYVMALASRDGSIACTLTNAPPRTQGPTNTVTAVCTAPAGGATSTSAVVNVTGP